MQAPDADGFDDLGNIQVELNKQSFYVKKAFERCPGVSVPVLHCVLIMILILSYGLEITLSSMTTIVIIPANPDQTECTI